MPHEIFERYATQQGWSLDSQVEVLLHYIENQTSPEAFEDFLAGLAEGEID